MNKSCINFKVDYPNSLEYFRTENANACRQCGEYYLTEIQKNFIKENQIYSKQVFDIHGMAKKNYQQHMLSVDKIIGVGANPCRTLGHTLKMLSGHCPQCNKHHVQFTLRWFNDKYVYLAFSSEKKLIKIGITDNILKRELSLNDTNYGNINDWKIIESEFVKKAGQVEAKIQKQLLNYRVYRKFWKQNKIVRSSEIFKCSIETAQLIFKKIKIDN